MTRTKTMTRNDPPAMSQVEIDDLSRGMADDRAVEARLTHAAREAARRRRQAEEVEVILAEGFGLTTAQMTAAIRRRRRAKVQRLSTGFVQPGFFTADGQPVE